MGTTGDTDTNASGALERLYELAVLLVDGMDRGLGEQGLTRARAELIWRLHRQGPTTQRDLSRMLQCTPRNVTGLVDALESGGLVVRRPHPSDRRATLVALTEQGRRAAADWQAGYQEVGTLLFADLGPAELGRFAATLDILLKRLRDGTAGTAADGNGR
ncbi:MAG: MarR family winged helix-turn-helix transcriptional regulator [Nitrososphaerota archaeon]